MEDIVIKPSKVKNFKLFLLCLILFIITLIFHVNSSQSIHDFRGLFFSISITIYFFINSINQAPKVIIKKEGLFYYGILIPWNKIIKVSRSSSSSPINFIKVELQDYDILLKSLPVRIRINIIINRCFNENSFYINTTAQNLDEKDILETLNNYKECYTTSNEVKP